MARLREILEYIAAEQNLNPHPVRVSNVDTGSVSHTDEKGNTTYFVEWALGAAPSAAVVASTAAMIDNQSIIAVPQSTESSLPVFDGSFPSGNNLPMGFEVRRADIEDGAVFTWHPNVGPNGEWWNERRPWWDGWGVSSGTSSGAYFRRLNGMVMSATAGIPIYERIRILRVSGTWAINETGTVQVRQNGVSAGRNVPINNAEFVNFVPPLTDNIWVVGNGGAVNSRQVLAGFWTGSSGSMNAAQFRLEGVRALAA